jgi:hypothetical protein
MTNPAGFDFTKFVPGFDFLKNLTPGGGAAASSAAPGWVAPTLDPEELEKRIQELKTWLNRSRSSRKKLLLSQSSPNTPSLKPSLRTCSPIQRWRLKKNTSLKPKRLKPRKPASPVARKQRLQRGV